MAVGQEEKQKNEGGGGATFRAYMLNNGRPLFR